MIIFLYIVFSVYSYATRSQIRYYEVLEGGIVRQEQYTGVAIREEKAVNASSSGYIHYYIQEGHRVPAGANVYTVDETGALESYLKDHPELTTELTGEQLADIRYRLSQFSQTFKNDNFSELYNTKYSLDASALEYSSISGAQDLDKILQQLGINYARVSSDEGGVVSYVVDGLEGLTDKAVTKDTFAMSGYKQNITKPGALVEAGTPVYKLITSANWSIVFPCDEETRQKYQDKKKIKVHFTDKDLTVNASLDIYTADDGKNYGKITLNQLMEEFCANRYIQFEIVTSDQKGLKIPATSVTKKDFMIVPKDFMAQNEEGNSGFYRTRKADGSTLESAEFVPEEIYRIDDQYCYIDVPDSKDTTSLHAGDVIVRKGTTDQTYAVGPVKSIEGVYNINKGYCIFRQIVPMEKNNEYIVVAENTDYGISVYDHIVLDASLVKEGQLIYQ